MNESNALLTESPLADLDPHFGAYLSKVKAEHADHMLGHGVTDYAYKTDLELRKKLDSIPGVFNTFKKITSTQVAQQLQAANLQDLSVGPNRFPEVYALTCDCAKRLGIAVPNVYIRDSDQLNAMALAADDIEPFILIYSPGLQRLSKGELKCMIAHECGHIHNFHSMYDYVARILLDKGQRAALGIAGALLRQLQSLMTLGIELTLNMWSRAAEVTADRAALICCDNVDDAYSLNKKLLYGGREFGDKINDELSIESLREQMEMSMNNPTGLLELGMNHPLIIKRIFAEMEFVQCDVFYKWRPDLRKPGMSARPKSIADERCKKYIDVIRKKGGSK